MILNYVKIGLSDGTVPQSQIYGETQRTRNSGPL